MIDSDVLVIGGGAAGVMSAIAAADEGATVIVLEKNEKIGKKLYITGKGRCNLTNACDMDELFENICTNSKFMFSSIHKFSNYDVMNFFENEGLNLKTERGNRVFPASDKSSDVIKTLTNACKNRNIQVLFGKEVKKLNKFDDEFVNVTCTDGSKFCARSVVIATGGLSYKSTGSTGDGYVFAREMGHKIKDTSPSLVPMNVKGNICQRLQGLSLKNVEISFYMENNPKKKVAGLFGEMMFTHFGITGPIVLSASALIGKESIKKGCFALVDLKPALDETKLDKRILREFDGAKNTHIKNILPKLLPKKMADIFPEICGIDPDKPVYDITKEERKKLRNTIKNLKLDILSLRDINEAVITRGGIDTSQINPSTMESKLVEGIYFAGEIIDTDAYTGGFNLQIAWSSGYAAGVAAAKRR